MAEPRCSTHSQAFSESVARTPRTHLRRPPLSFAWPQPSTGPASARETPSSSAFVASVIITAGALASFHRAAGIAVVAILILATVPGARNRSARYLALCIIGVASGLAFYAVSGSVEHSTFFQGRVESTTNVTGRFASWEQSVAIFKHAPVIGVGVGQAPVVQEKEGLFTFAGQQAAVTIHNSFLTVLAENGVTGEAAFLFLCLTVVALLVALRRYPYLRVLYGVVLAGSVAFLVMSLTLTMLLEAPAVLMLSVLLGVGAGQLDRQLQPPELVAGTRARPEYASEATGIGVCGLSHVPGPDARSSSSTFRGPAGRLSRESPGGNIPPLRST